MPLHRLILESNLNPEDGDLLEALFNQFAFPGEEAKQRHDRAAGLVKLFVDGERDRQVLINYLVSRGSSTSDHSISGTSPV